MTPCRAQRQRPDRALERLHRRHVGGIYRFALALTGDPSEAEHVTRETFCDARRRLQGGRRPRNLRTWLFEIAHDACRQILQGRECAEGAGPPLEENEETVHASSTCAAAEMTILGRLDRRLPPWAALALRVHLRACVRCDCFAARQRAQRSALEALTTVPLPPSLVRTPAFLHDLGGETIGRK